MPRALESSTYSTKLLVTKAMLSLIATYTLRTPSTSQVHLRRLHVEMAADICIYTYTCIIEIYLVYD